MRQDTHITAVTTQQRKDTVSFFLFHKILVYFYTRRTQYTVYLHDTLTIKIRRFDSKMNARKRTWPGCWILL